MILENLRTSEHIKEVMNHPNPMVLEATKAYFSGQKIDLEAIGDSFLKIYLENESKMYMYLNNIMQQETAMRSQDILPEETVARASEAPKFKI